MVKIWTSLILVWLSFSSFANHEPKEERNDETGNNSGLLISGGWDGARTSVEMFVPSSNLSCSFPSLPDSRYQHTMSGLTICGGATTRTTCLQLSSGQWSVSHNLTKMRYHHSSWESDQGVVLMGGYLDSALSSEVVGQGGVAFDMKYDIRSACAISDGDSVLLTGGEYFEQRVSRYDATGYVGDLPRLNGGRYQHGCAAYHRQDGTKVFLVAGGWDDDDLSTELLVENSDAWTMTTPLPKRVFRVRGATLGNIVYMTGVTDDNDRERTEILAWSEERKEWEEVGKMKVARTNHAITTISVKEVTNICS